ncbi:MAG TPA: hypothetical protein VGZ73_01810, partial [Bryobacteraceae bacterium]|nr:hypothetical protein [Bryobacteraceae bacterium]
MLLHNKRILTTLAFATAAAAVALRGQQTKPSSPPQDETPKFTSDVRVVVLPTTVVDKNGHLVTDLTKD